MTKESVEAEIRNAFAGVEFPQVFVFSNPFGIDLELVQGFQNKKWETIASDVDFLMTHRDFSFLTAKAILYLLPAYLIACLRESDVVRDQLQSAVLIVICPPSWAGSLIDRRNEVLKSASSGQKSAIALWIEYFLTSPTGILPPSDEPGMERSPCLETWHSAS